MDLKKKKRKKKESWEINNLLLKIMYFLYLSTHESLPNLKKKKKENKTNI